MATVVGVPKEVKDQEGCVAMQPDGVATLAPPLSITDDDLEFIARVLKKAIANL
jgi:adenosylmethionine-8-amino-7-oxononanoate aminotransferase